MHRHRIRAFVAGKDTDVPVTIFAAGQYVRFISGVGLLTTSLGPGTTTVNAIATWGDTTGTQLLLTPVLLDNAGNMSQLVTLDGQDAPRITATLSTATPTTGKLTKWASNAAPWKLDSTLTLQVVTADGADGLYGVSVINGRDPSKWVEGPASVLAGSPIARFSGTTGKLIQSSTVYLDDSGSISNVLNLSSLNGTLSGFQFVNGVVTIAFEPTGSITGLATLNGRDPSKWVEGPASATSGALATFNGTTGKLIQSATSIAAAGGALSNVSTINGVDPGTWVRGPTSSTANRAAVWNSTDGRVITDSPVAIDVSGNVTGVTTLNTVAPSDWVQGPASAIGSTLAMFNGTSGKFLSDTAIYSYELLKGTVSFFGGSTGTVPGYGLPKRASSYRVGFVAFVPVTFGDTTGTISLSMSSDDNNGAWMVQMPNASAARSLGSGGTWPNPGTFTSAGFIFSATAVVPSGSGIYNLNLNISSSGSMSMLTGWQMWCY